jgi:all-trans-retinol 13,14-reductase
MTQNVQTGSSAATNFSIVAWLAYGALSSVGHWVGAAITALIVAIAIVAFENRRNAVKIMSLTTVGYFAFALVVTTAIGPWLFKYYNISLAWGLFALVAWVTLLVGFPFTIQYAREQAPREIWDHPLFMRLNVILTVVFALMFSVNSVLGALALVTGRLLTLGILLPISLLVAAIIFSGQYPKRYFQRVAPDWVAAQAQARRAND